MDQEFLARGQAFLENRMRDTCRITKPGEGGRGTLDRETGKYAGAPDPVVVYEGPCRIPKRASAQTSAAGTSAGDASWDVGEFPLDIPIAGSGYKDAGEVGTGMTVEYLTSADRPDLAGHVFGISEVSRQSQATVARFRMKEVVGS